MVHATPGPGLCYGYRRVVDGQRRVAVIGDLAGHRDELATELARLGADARGVLPADLVVVQLGDLVHRGPDSDGVIALVDRYLDEQPGQWVQLAGNHEAQYLREPVFDWPERIGERAQDTIRAWWAGGTMRAAAAIHTTDEDFVVTHAGLTEGFWRRALDRPARASDAARALNSFIGTHEDVLFSAGQMLGGGQPDFTAGPLWAAAGTELVTSWGSGPLPFSQVHGHASVVDWQRRRLRCDDSLARRLTIDEDAAHASIAFDRARIVGVDPGHGRRPHRPWRAFVLDAAVVDW